MNDSRKNSKMIEKQNYHKGNHSIKIIKSSEISSTPSKIAKFVYNSPSKCKLTPRFTRNLENDFRGQNSQTSQKSNFRESSYRNLMSEKRDILSKLKAARQQNQKYIEQENSLKNEIAQINEKSAYTMQVLDQRKERLLIENDELLSSYQSFPPIEFLKTQLSVLNNLLNRKKREKELMSKELNKPNKKAVINEEIMRKLGIIQRTNEDLSIVPERLAYLVNRLETFKQTFKEMKPKSQKCSIDASADSFQREYNDPTAKEKKELMRKIKLLKVSMKSSFRHTEFQCENLRSDVHRLEAECEMIQTIQASVPHMGLRRTRSFSTDMNRIPLCRISKNDAKSDDCDISISDNSDFIEILNSSAQSNSSEKISPIKRNEDKTNISHDFNQMDENHSVCTKSSNAVELKKAPQNIVDENVKEAIAISPLSNLNIYDQDVQRILKGAGGDPNLLHYNGNNEYEYNGFRFTVIKKDKKLYAVSENETLILPIFLSNIIYL